MDYITEVEEILIGKNLDALHKELDFQIGNGESLGGSICSQIIEAMNINNRDFAGKLIKGDNFMTPTKLKSFINNIGMRVEVSEGIGFDNKAIYGCTYASDSGIILNNLNELFDTEEEAIKHSNKYKK